MVLNMVYLDLMTGASKEDRADIDGWCDCTVQEAFDFTSQDAASEAAERRRLIGLAGEVVTQ